MDKDLKSGDSLNVLANNNDLSGLVDKVGHFMSKSMAVETKRAYKCDWNSFLKFCEFHRFEPMPAESKTVQLYITKLASEGKAVATIQRHLTTISQAHAAFRHNSPTTDYDTIQTLKGIKRQTGTAQKKAKPLVWGELKKVMAAMRPNIIGHRDKALLSLGWAAALRRSEVVALDFEDIEVVDEGVVVNIRQSKTDQNAEGYKIGVPWAEDKKFCPATAVVDFLKRSKIDSGPVFFAIGRNGKQFFLPPSRQRHRLSSKSVNLILSRRLADAGIKSVGYSGHSLRAGFITSAAAAKVPEYMIQQHTRHRSTKTLRGYIRDGSLFADNTLAIMI